MAIKDFKGFKSTNDTYNCCDTPARDSIAPTEADATSASQPYEVNEQFYLSDGNLYTATSPISQNDAFIVYPTSGYNCKLSDSVTGQIKEVKDDLAEKVSWDDTEGYVGKNLISYPNGGTKQLLASDGTITDDNSFWLSDYIPVDEDIYVYYTSKTQSNAAFRIGFYTQNKTFIERITTFVDKVVVGNTVKYIRVCLDNSAVSYFVKPMVCMYDVWNIYQSYMPYIPKNSELMTYADNSKLGAYNILNNTANSKDIFGVDKDKVVTVNTSGVSWTASLVLQTNISNLVGMGMLHISGCPQGGSDTKYEIAIWNSNQQSLLNTETNQRVREYGNGYDVDLTRCTNPDGTAVDFTTCTVVVVIRSGAGALNNLKFYPMITLESNKGLSYQPYAETNRELTVNKADNSVIGKVEDGTNPTKAYEVGEHFIRNGKFCTVTVAVTTSSTWTLGSNYVEGTIADNLVKQATFTETTDANGLVEIYNGNRNVIKCESSVGNRIILPFYSNSRSKVMARCIYEDGSVIESVAVSGTYYYI